MCGAVAWALVYIMHSAMPRVLLQPRALTHARIVKCVVTAKCILDIIYELHQTNVMCLPVHVHVSLPHQ